MTSYKDWPTVDVRSGKDTVKRSKHFPRLTVEDLKAVTQKTPEPLTKLQKWGTPTYMMLNPAEEQIGSLPDRGGVSVEKMLADAAAAQKALGASATYSVYQEFQKAMAANALPALIKLKGQTEPMKAAVTSRAEEMIEDAGEDRDALKKLAVALKGHALEKKVREKLKE